MMSFTKPTNSKSAFLQYLRREHLAKERRLRELTIAYRQYRDDSTLPKGMDSAFALTNAISVLTTEMKVLEKIRVKAITLL